MAIAAAALAKSSKKAGKKAGKTAVKSAGAMGIDQGTIRFLSIWIVAGVGTFLMYSAVTNRPPWDVLQGIRDTKIFSGSSGQTQNFAHGIGSTAGAQNVPTDAREKAMCLGNRSCQNALTLVSIPGGGQLDIVAAESFKRVTQRVGYIIPNVGAYRSYAWQATNHAADPGRFADPDGSMHVVGLAIDIHRDYKDRPEVIQAMTQEGWQRYDPQGESWHWSYIVRG